MFFFSSRRRHTRLVSDWSSDVCSSDLKKEIAADDGKLKVTVSGTFVHMPETVTFSLPSSAAISFFSIERRWMRSRSDLIMRSEERRVGKEIICVCVMAA